MRRRPPRSTRTDTLFPYTTLFRSPIRQYTAERYGNPAMGAAILDGARCSIRFAPERDRMTCAGYADGPVGFELFRARHSPPTMLVIDDHRPVASHVDRKSTRLNSSH